MNQASQEPTNQAILEAVNSFATDTEKRLGRIEMDVGAIKAEMGSIKAEMGSIKAEMVTKDFLTVKLADLKGDIVVIVRKEDAKLTALIEELVKRNLLPADVAKRILSMQPFPQLSV